jgi:tRNA-splicing ligase RtcB (3'-phosphate/5'-hydroxy nucleic acid ligase)
LKAIVAQMYQRVPTGVGAHRRDLKLSQVDLRRVLEQGAGWATRNGFGDPADLDRIEEQGRLPGANPDLVSARAFERGSTQLGTLGSGNHFAEVQYVAEIYDERIAQAFGLFKDQVTVMIHSGSRGLGHQVCEDHLRVMIGAARKYGIELPDRQLCCAPVTSPEGEAYLGAMAAAANFAFANRQVMSHWVRESVAAALEMAPHRTGIDIVYDVCHNIAKMEEFPLDPPETGSDERAARYPQIGGRGGPADVRTGSSGSTRRLCVHRKGSTRAYPPGHPQTPEAYRDVGQPVLIPGDMGRYSYVLAGTERAFRETFGSTCHGAGRRWSRGEAKRAAKGHAVIKEMEARGVTVMAAGAATVAEEMPEAYKDVADVVRVVHEAGLARRVAQLRPIGVIKG